MRRIDETGHTFGKLHVIEYAGNSMWKCRCECGNVVHVFSGNLRNGSIRSCGCYKKEILSNKMSTHHESQFRLYKIWKAMRRRCDNPNYKDFNLYGGRGITYCSAWKVYENFRDWAINNGYTDELSIDRIDPNGNYDPKNCRWATMKTQARNKRDTVWVEIDGTVRTIPEWSELSGVGENTIRWRQKHGIINASLLVPAKRGVRPNFSDVDRSAI